MKAHDVFLWLMTIYVVSYNNYAVSHGDYVVSPISFRSRPIVLLDTPSFFASDL